MQQIPNGYPEGTGHESFCVTSKRREGYSGQHSSQTKQHTLGHRDCLACADLRAMSSCSLSATLPFAEAAEIYLRWRSPGTPETPHAARYIKPRTGRDYRQYIRSLNLFFGEMRLDSIHLGHLREYQMARSEGRAPFVRRRRPHEDPRPLPCKAPLINKELCLLQMILRRANAWTEELQRHHEYLDESGPETQRALSVDEQQHWLATAAMSPRWSTVHWYSIVAFDTACSTNELRALRLGDVNLHHRTISVPRDGAKNRYRQRTLAIENAECLWALEQLVLRARDLGASEPMHYLFPFHPAPKAAWDVTRPMTVSGLKRPWQEVRDASGLGWFRMYDTRHTAITRMAETGIPMALISERAGHIGPRLTRHYTHIGVAAQRRWLQRPLMPGPVAPRPLLPERKLAAASVHPFEPPAGYKTIYVAGVAVSVPA